MENEQRKRKIFNIYRIQVDSCNILRYDIYSNNILANRRDRKDRNTEEEKKERRLEAFENHHSGVQCFQSVRISGPL